MIAQYNYYLAMEQRLIYARKNGAGPLYEACHNGHDSIVRLLLSNGANINSCMEGDAGPLFKLVKTDIQRALYNCYWVMAQTLINVSKTEPVPSI